jgi:hypothetical protein
MSFSELSLLEGYLLFIGTWVESLYHIDLAECISDESCALKILDMHGEVFPLAIRNQYVNTLLTLEKLLKTY